jgi:hypothetical protein
MFLVAFSHDEAAEKSLGQEPDKVSTVVENVVGRSLSAPVIVSREKTDSLILQAVTYHDPP